jgi:hypothetical protein
MSNSSEENNSALTVEEKLNNRRDVEITNISEKHDFLTTEMKVTMASDLIDFIINSEDIQRKFFEEKCKSQVKRWRLEHEYHVSTLLHIYSSKKKDNHTYFDGKDARLIFDVTKLQDRFDDQFKVFVTAPYYKNNEYFPSLITTQFDEYSFFIVAEDGFYLTMFDEKWNNYSSDMLDTLIQNVASMLDGTHAQFQKLELERTQFQKRVH